MKTVDKFIGVTLFATMLTTYVHFVQANYATEDATFGNQRIVTSAEYAKPKPTGKMTGDEKIIYLYGMEKPHDKR